VRDIGDGISGLADGEQDRAHRIKQTGYGWAFARRHDKQRRRLVDAQYYGIVGMACW